MALFCSNPARITLTGTGEWTDEPVWHQRVGPQAYKKTAVLFVLEICADWKLRAGLEKPRVIPGTQA